MVARRGGETLIAGEQRSVERFGKGYVDGIIGREIVPQIPDPPQKEIVRISVQGKIREVGESRATTFAIDLAVCRITSDHLRDFNIEQMRHVQRLPGVEQPLFHGLCRRRTKERFEQGRSVDDDQWRSRSARTAWAGATEGVIPERRSKRARRSASVGRSATSRISPSR